MRIPLADTLRRIDRHWLLNHPVLWIMKLHWAALIGIFGLLLICLTALAFPISLQDVRSLNVYFGTVLALAGLVISPWIYLQARFAPQLRQNYQVTNAIYLLAGYLLIFGIQLAWPYTFVRILEVRISSSISETELRKDLHEVMEAYAGLRTMNKKEYTALSLNAWKDIAWRLSLKYQQPRLRMNIFNNRDLNAVTSEMIDIIESILSIKKNDPRGIRDSRVYNNRLVASQAALLFVLLLRSFQTTDVKSLLFALIVGTPIWCAVIFSIENDPSSKIDIFLICTIVSVFLAGLFLTFYAPRLKEKGVAFTGTLNIFSMLTAWMPLFVFCTLGGKVDSEELHAALFFLGIIVHLAATPWIQRSYLVLQSQPS